MASTPIFNPSPPESDLVIRLFGPLDIRLNGEPLARFHSRKEPWLLVLLILRNGREVTRDWLAGTLWPDSPTEQSLAYLRRTLYLLKRALGAHAARLQSPTSRTLVLDLSGAYADVIAFDEALQRGDTDSLEEAVRLYRGPLLDDCYEEWVETERSERHHCLVASLETLAARARERGCPSEAVPLLRRLIDLDPLREEAHRALMQALSDCGDQGAMVQAFQNLCRILQEELGTDPSPETVNLYDALSAASRREAHYSPGFAARLPRYLTPLIGREQELRAIANALDASPLITLTGTGGVGKTRLAVQVAQEYSEAEVWFVGLAAVTETMPLAPLVARSLGMKEANGLPIEETLVHALASRPGLLVLDNCEHLLDACAALIHLLLNACPGLRVLITSRQTLGILGEIEFPVLPMEIPALSATRDGSSADKQVSALWEYAAVRLFVQRARSVSPAFHLTPHNAASVAQICARLDGIPLAIEMAAAWTKTLSPEQIVDRLNDRFHLLSRGSRGDLPHHQTLRALLDWSYQLLNEKQQQLLHRLSVFVGGWTLDALETIEDGLQSVMEEGRGKREELTARDERKGMRDERDLNAQSKIQNPKSKMDVLDLLTSLVDRSLVQVEMGERGIRYRLLETIQTYASERLETEGHEAATESRRRHCRYYLRFVDSLSAELWGERQQEALTRFEAEHDNLRAALQWSLSGEQGPEIALKLCGALTNFWVYRGYYREGQTWCEKALRRSGEMDRTSERAYALAASGTMAWMQGDLEQARRMHQKALSIRRDLGDKQLIAISAERVGTITLRMGDLPAAMHLLNESVTLARHVGNQRVLATGLINWGCMMEELDRFDEARNAWSEALILTTRLGHKLGSALSLGNLGNLAERTRDYEQARSLYGASLDIMREFGDQGGLALMTFNLGSVDEALGAYDQARQRIRSALKDWRTWGNKENMLLGIERLAFLVLSEAPLPSRVQIARYQLGARLLGAVEKTRERLHCITRSDSKERYAECLRILTGVLGQKEMAAQWSYGREMSLEEAVLLALEAA